MKTMYPKPFRHPAETSGKKATAVFEVRNKTYIKAPCRNMLEKATAVFEVRNKTYIKAPSRNMSEKATVNCSV